MLLIGECKEKTCGGVHRRALVQAGLVGAFGLSLSQHAALAGALSRKKSILLLWLWGGPSHLDTLDPKPDAPSEYRGPYRAVSTNVPGIRITELLPNLARHMDRCAIVRSLHHETNDHGLAGTTVMTGRAPASGIVHPHMGAILSRARREEEAPAVLSSYVTIGETLHQGHRAIQGEGGGILGSVYDPFRVRYDVEEGVLLGETAPPAGVTAARVDRRQRLLSEMREQSGVAAGTRDSQALDRFYQQAFQLMTSSEGRRVFDLSQETPKTRDAYGRHRFGQSCLLARRLLESGVGFVQVNWSQHVESEEDAGDGGWDNHYRNFEMLAERQCLPFDATYATLINDLEARGLLESTVVVAMGEFGRTPKINAFAGRDHWPSCYSALLAGGGVRGGQVIGASDDRGEYPASKPVTPADLCTSILDLAGISRSDVLALGLPVQGDVIEELR